MKKKFLFLLVMIMGQNIVANIGVNDHEGTDPRFSLMPDESSVDKRDPFLVWKNEIRPKLMNDAVFYGKASAVSCIATNGLFYKLGRRMPMSMYFVGTFAYIWTGLHALNQGLFIGLIDESGRVREEFLSDDEDDELPTD